MDNAMPATTIPGDKPRASLDWLPLVVLPCIAIAFRGGLQPWVFMWALAVAVFAGFKWWTWRRTISLGVKTTAFRSIAFLFLWPGMDAGRFLALDRRVPKPGTVPWMFAAAKTLFGAALIWEVAPLAGNGWGAG